MGFEPEGSLTLSSRFRVFRNRTGVRGTIVTRSESSIRKRLAAGRSNVSLLKDSNSISMGLCIHACTLGIHRVRSVVFFNVRQSIRDRRARTLETTKTRTFSNERILKHRNVIPVFYHDSGR